MRLFDIEHIDYTYIHTGQHHDFNLFLNFINEFNIRKPDYVIKLDHPNDPIIQFSEILSGVGKALKKYKTSSLMTVGDTNSVAAASLLAQNPKFQLSM